MPTFTGMNGEKGEIFMITEQKEKAITELIKGQSRTDIGKIIGVARSTIYDWLKDPEFNSELELRRKDIVKSGNDFIIARTSSYLDELNDLALTSADARTKASVLMYLVDRSLGKIAQRYEVEPVETAKVPSREELEKEFKTYKTYVGL
jgi:DNA-binding XRE family transcriptional regulator